MIGRRATRAPAAAPHYRNPLDAVPEVAPDVAVVRRTDDGALVLRRTLAPRSRLGHALARWLSFRRETHVQLDARGGVYWSLVDGRTPLDRIASCAGERLGLDREAARKSVLLYTRDLMTRGFVHLRIDAHG